MDWVLLASLAGLASNGFNITNRFALKNKGDHTAYAWWFEFVRTVFFLILVLRQPLPSLSLQNIGALALLGITELFSVYVFMKMHALTELSISSIISRLRIIWSPLLAWLLVGERLTMPEYIGIVIIFLGLAVVTSPKQIRTDRGIHIALLFSFSSALLSIVLKWTGGIANTEVIIVSQSIVPLFILPICMKNATKRIVKIGKTNLFHTLVGGAFNVASSYLLVEALRVADASKVVGLYQAMTLFSVLFGIFILKEKEKLLAKIIGSLIVITGIMLMVK